MAPAGPILLPLSPTTTIHATGPIFLVAGGSGGGLPPFAQQLFKSQHHAHRRAVRRVRLQTLLLSALVCVGVVSFLDVRGGLQAALARARSGGRGPPPARDLDFPVQSCCIGEQCVLKSRGRHAVVTHVRSQSEVAQLQQLRASLRRSNPGIDLAVMLVRGELGAAPTQRIMSMGLTVFYVEPPPLVTQADPARLRTRSGGARSSSPNWLKLRAFGLTQFDAVLLVEPSARVAGDISPLFSLPTDFAAGWDQARWLDGGSSVLDAVSGGGLFLRPCATTEAHMLEILRQRSEPVKVPQSLLATATAAAGRQQGAAESVGAEHEFLAWYFQYTGMTLPFDVYVINMDGEVGQKRLAAFQRTFGASDLKSKGFVRYPAVNGTALDANRLVTGRALEEIKAAESLGYRTRHYQLTHGSLGCYMSHLQLYQHIIKTGTQFAFVFEDDAVIVQPGLLAALVDAKPFPDDWDVMLLGHYCHDCPLLLDAPAFRLARSFFGTHAYVVHRRGLQKIFGYPHLMPIEMQIDAVLGDMCQQGLLNVYALAEPLVKQNNKEFRTTIQIPVKRRIGVDPYKRAED